MRKEVNLTTEDAREIRDGAERFGKLPNPEREAANFFKVELQGEIEDRLSLAHLGGLESRNILVDGNNYTLEELLEILDFRTGQLLENNLLSTNQFERNPDGSFKFKSTKKK